MKIAIFGQYYQNDTRPIIRDIFVFLNANFVELLIEAKFLAILYEEKIVAKPYKTFETHEDLKEVDLLLSIGGDGTILRATTYVRNSGIPILGINAGRLGFLAKVQKDNIAQLLEKVLKKQFTISNRSLISVEISNDQDPFFGLNFALNEISISRKDTTSMITVETFLNNEYLTSYWADGLIISTPTGSTGYSLSCGGPVLLPDVSSFVITPIAPHNLNARPLVIPDSMEIRMKVSGRESQFLVSLDSRIVSLQNEVQLRVSKASFAINMVEIESESFLQTLRKKLLWGEDRRN
jgi:NAD+ kinase